jgi:hypothetical protein
MAKKPTKPKAVVDPNAPKKLTPYDFVNAVTFTKKELFDTELPEDAEKAYVPYVVNRALSLTADTVKAAQAMNLRSWLPKREQFSFLLNMIRARKRYAKWLKKPASDEQVDLVAKYYGMSVRKARQVVRLHTPEQLDLMQSRMDRGGRNSA